MKITRILLVFAAAFSFGLAVFASIRNQSSTVTTSHHSLFTVADDGAD